MDNKDASTYLISHDDIDFMSKQLAEMTKGNANDIAAELMAMLIVSNVRNGG